MPGVDFRGTAGNEGKGIVAADGFTSTGPTTINGSIAVTALNIKASGVKTITFAPPSLATGIFATSSPIAVAGVALGDMIELYPPYATQGVIYQASPSTAGNIVINLFNASAATVALASGSWKVVVRKLVA